MRSRLQAAALELFRERGYDQTTASQIAGRAGVTERTFFRYFPDKREVLFDGEAVLREALTASIATAPERVPPLDLLFRAFRSVLPALEDNRPYAKPRYELIAATPALHERELGKTDALATALAAALVERGVSRHRAMLAARTGMAAFVDATVSWLEDASMDLGDRLFLAEREMRSLLRNDE